MKKWISYQDELIRDLQDPTEAKGYLNAAIQEGDPEIFFIALKNVAQAQPGGLTNLAKNAGINRNDLQKILTGKSNPTLKDFFTVMQALGLHFSIDQNAA